MKCSTIQLGGAIAIVCGSRRLLVCKCGQVASRLCDWKLAGGGTCSKPVCDDCTTSPAPNKDLCTDHGEAWKDHPANKQQSLPMENNDGRKEMEPTAASVD